MAWTKTKMAVAAGVGALLAVGTAIVTVKEIEAHRIYPGLAGVWEGTYFAQRVALKIARTNGTYLATFDFIDSGMDIPASNLKVGKNAISFRRAGHASQVCRQHRSRNDANVGPLAVWDKQLSPRAQAHGQPGFQ